MATGLVYFDQFMDIEVDLTPYDKFMKGFDSNFGFSNWQPIKVKLKNLFEQSQVINTYLKDRSYFTRYTVLEGERIENVSYKFYRTHIYWWIIAVFNNIKDPFNDWPMTNDQIVEIAKRLEQEEGLYPYEVYFNLLFEENEKKRNLMILLPTEVNNVVYDFVRHLQQYGIVV